MTRRLPYLLALAVLLAAGAPACFAQATDGQLVGTVYDPSGAAVPGVRVELADAARGLSFTATTDAGGQYRFPNVPIGTYVLSAAADGFAPVRLAGLNITLNTTATRNVTLELTGVASTVSVVEAPVAIDTTTAQISAAYQSRQATDLPMASLALGAINLSLLNAGVASSGGYGLGEGPSVGGQRPRNNNFTVEGVDNNRKDVSGSNLRISNEATAEITILQNQFTAEFGHAGGGQFNTVVKSGTNQLHGSVYEYLQNRKLNALDESSRRSGITEKPRFDDNRLGASIGGPVIKNKLFYFGNFEYNPSGAQGSSAAAIMAPTDQGYSMLQSLGGLSQTNLGVLKQYLPAAPTATATTEVSGAAIPIGELPITVPQYLNTYNAVASSDYSISGSDQLRGRFMLNKQSGIDPSVSPALPSFIEKRVTSAYAASISEFHTFNANLNNELRAGYNRYSDDIPSGSYEFPGLDMFPNIVLEQDLNLQLGPYDTAPQSTVVNTYQITDNVSLHRGRHDFKFGAEAHKYIAPQNFIQRVRGDYWYSNLERYLLDLTPDVLAERNLGGMPYSGNQLNFYWFVQDNWRLRPNLTLNIGLRHELKGIPAGDKLQALNASSSRPGLLDFRAPRPDRKMFAPRLGVAWSPGTSGATSIRAGIGLSYDNYVDNFSTLSKPPQVESTIDDDITQNNPGYLAGGGIAPSRRPDELSPDVALALTSAYIPDQRLPYSVQWNLGIQHVFANDYTIEARYVGTRGVRLYTQNRANVTEPIARPEDGLPTYLQRPSQSELDGLSKTLSQLENISYWVPKFDEAGFNQQPLMIIDPRGNSIYHGLALELTRRFAGGLYVKPAYTWSKNIDDSTADLYSTLLCPRRPQAFQNMRNERGVSFLDRTHRFSVSWIYDTPWYRTSQTWWKRNLLGNYTIGGAYMAETGQPATVQSGLDSNLNRDSAGDRALVNPNGQANIGSGVSPLYNSAGEVVAYLADNPNARYIVAGPGVFPTAGRNTMRMPGINNWDVSVTKRVNFGETRKFEVKALFLNALNHPQYVPGYVNSALWKESRTTRNHLIPGNALFGDATRVFDSNARAIQLVARFEF